MASRRTKNTRSVQSKEELSREMRRSKLALFIQQFEKEGEVQPRCSLAAASLQPHPRKASYFISDVHPSFLTAQERVNEMEAKMENTLATVEKVFKVELMKMPPSLQNTLIGDLISGESSVIFVILSVLHEQQLPTVFSCRGGIRQ